MLAEPIVSILMPFYQTADFMDEAIRSVLTQTYANWELLLIYDGGADGSLEIASRWAAEYPNRIRLLAHPDRENHGLPAARNLGLAQARGDYIALLDADDVWLPEKLQHQVMLALRHPHCALFGEASLYWYSWSPQARASDQVIAPGIAADTCIEPPQAALTLYPLGEGAAPCPTSLLMKTEVLRRLGGFETAFSGPYMVFEDQAFLIKFYLQETVYFSSSCLNRYRQRPESLMGSLQQKGNYIALKRFFLRWLQAYLHTHIPNPDLQVMQALRRQLHTHTYWRKIHRLFALKNMRFHG
jgi:hypothetical protein